MSALLDYVNNMPESYRKSINLLDNYFKNNSPWQSRINLDELNMKNATKCILGQLFQDDAEWSGYVTGCEKLNIGEDNHNYAFHYEANSFIWHAYLTLWNNEQVKLADVVYNVDKKAFTVVARTEKNMVLAAADGFEFMVALDDAAFTTEKLPVNIYRMSDTDYRYSRSDSGILVKIKFDDDFADVKLESLTSAPLYLCSEVVEFIAAKMKKE